MTEVEWLICANPEPMLNYLEGNVSERKLRLFAVACCRRIIHLLRRKEFIEIIDIAERIAENLASREECNYAQTAYSIYESMALEERKNTDLAVVWASTIGATYPSQYAFYVSGNSCRLGERWIISQTLSEEQISEQMLHTTLLRDIYSYHAISIDHRWLTSTVTALAEQMYDSRDFSAMPILADALQDAGCDNAGILDHCRGPGPHVRGCWVVDKLLSRE